MKNGRSLHPLTGKRPRRQRYSPSTATQRNGRYIKPYQCTWMGPRPAGLKWTMKGCVESGRLADQGVTVRRRLLLPRGKACPRCVLPACREGEVALHCQIKASPPPIPAQGGTQGFKSWRGRALGSCLRRKDGLGQQGRSNAGGASPDGVRAGSAYPAVRPGCPCRRWGSVASAAHARQRRLDAALAPFFSRVAIAHARADRSHSAAVTRAATPRSATISMRCSAIRT